MLNKYVWELYIKSGGESVIKFFENSLSSSSGITEVYVDKIFYLHKQYCVSRDALNYTKEQLLDLVSYFEENKINGSEITPQKDIEQSIDRIFSEEYKGWQTEQKTDKGTFELFIDNLANESTYLSVCYPGLFIPYYYFANYNVLCKIADAFDIELPDLPKKSDYKGRTWHYANLCKSLYRFREENDLTIYELCAFLYDFAPKYVGGIDCYIIKDLPEPKAAFFVGGGGDNGDAVAEDHSEEISFWQCNPDTRVGDMIVMYLRTPISAISSIWRSQSVGFIDPFFYYYRCTYIGSPQKVSRIPIQKIKTDPVLGKMPIVAKNMQGINGVELRPSDYNYIVDQSGIDLPKLEYAATEHSGEYVNEKQVEEELIKPFLKKLGYEESDYERQMYIEIGNHNHALIPDFVLCPGSTSGHYSGFAIVEAKRSIKNEKQLVAAKTQARSYAKLLGARYTVVASMEKVWIMSYRDDYTESFLERTWDDLSDTDALYEVEKTIGKRRSE